MPILNYTTKISPEKTVAEIQGRLVKNGARQVHFNYDEQGYLIGLSFGMEINSVQTFFCITPDVDGVLAALKKQRVQTFIK